MAADVGFVGVCRRLLEEAVDLEARDVVRCRDSAYLGGSIPGSFGQMERFLAVRRWAQSGNKKAF